MIPNTKLSGTKAETLLHLVEEGFPVPELYFFTVRDWNLNSESILADIVTKFSTTGQIAVRSSTKAEDTADASMAGAFHSILNVDAQSRDEIEKAVKEVIGSFDEALDNQVLVQPMVMNVQMSGVVMTKSLNDGSPYYVVNYDDTTGKTDSVTSGNSINKTVYIYNGVKDSDFDSPLLRMVLELVRSLEQKYCNTPLDIEFAIDKKKQIYLLQVRRITTSKNWNAYINQLVSSRIEFLRSYIDTLMQPRLPVFGGKTLLGIMPDWNPAEMIGVVPHPLAMSLYRELITKRVWSLAREKMGYISMPNVELMVSLFGRAYIDVRNSMNSFLPAGLHPSICEKLLNAYINRLEQDPHLHDKIEFEVVFTAYDFEFDKNFNERYPNVLSKEEFLEFKSLIRKLTKNAVLNDRNGTLNRALHDIGVLNTLQQKRTQKNNLSDPFTIADKVNSLLDECIKYGTLPFSIIARHAFIAEVLLRTAVNRNVISPERLSILRRSIRTVAGEMSESFYRVCSGSLEKHEFLKIYGHLRPSSYDILSPRYMDRSNLFDGIPQQPPIFNEFEFSNEEKSGLNILLAENGFDGLKAKDLLLYARKAIAGREYAKFIFTKHLSEIIEYIAQWGEIQGFSRTDMSMLSINDILDSLFAPLTKDRKEFYSKKIKSAREGYDVASSFKLNYLIRSSRDVNIVPMQRNQANYVGNIIVEGEIIFLNPYSNNIPDLKNKIVCIEGADPGYDWVFSRSIAGLITKYGGVNSHMAIRCAELNIPAAIGCGEQPFERILKAGRCLLDCQRQRLEPQSINLINNA